MSRFVVWIVNGALFVLCCFLTASLINGWVGEWLAGPSAEGTVAVAATPASARDWSDRKVILDRNLFQVSTLLPDEPAEPEALDEDEQLAATRLPLKLLGTVAASDPKAAWAAVEDTTKRERLVVRSQDRLLDKATVVRIERRRIVLENAGKREELALDEESPLGPAVARARVAGRPVPAVADMTDLQDRVRQLAEDRFEVQRDEVDEAMRNPAELFSQARILPKYDNGQMVGVQVNAIKPGSLFESIGIKNGCVITEMNGIKIDSPEQSAKILLEFVDAKRFDISVTECQGNTTLSWTPPS